MTESFNVGVLSGIAAVGFSTFVIEISDAIVSVILNNLRVMKGGDAAIITIGVITKVSMFMFITIIGISSSMQPIVAYNYGAQNYYRMKKALKIAIMSVTIASLGFWSIFMTFATPIIGFFLKDTLRLKEAIIAFRICISLLPAVGVYYVCIYYYQAIKQSRKSFLLSIYRQLVIFIPVAIIFVQMFGIIGAWMGVSGFGYNYLYNFNILHKESNRRYYEVAFELSPIIQTLNAPLRRSLGYRLILPIASQAPGVG